MTDPISRDDVDAAVRVVSQHLPRTPLYEWPGLSEIVGCRYYLKHENHLPVGAFKVRGGVNLVGTLSEDERQRGLIGVSTGNHAQSLAFAGRKFDVPVKIVVPAVNNPGKIAAVRTWGAEIIEHGHDFDAAREHCEALAEKHHYRYVHSANEPKLIAGVATCAMEIFDDLPRPDVILVPIGLGSGASSASLVAHWRSPATRVIGVQAENASAVAQSWRQGTMITTPSADTWCEGMATRVPAEMTLDLLRRYLHDVILVSEDALRQAARLVIEQTHNLVEGAGAASTAAALRLAQDLDLRGKTVVGVLSGGNLDLRELPRVMAAGLESF